jgi:hypothetical protein
LISWCLYAKGRTSWILDRNDDDDEKECVEAVQDTQFPHSDNSAEGPICICLAISPRDPSLFHFNLVNDFE